MSRGLVFYLYMMALMPLPLCATETTWSVERSAGAGISELDLLALTKKVGEEVMHQYRYQENLREEMRTVKEPARKRYLKSTYFSSRRLSTEALLHWTERGAQSLVVLVAGDIQQREQLSGHLWKESFVLSQGSLVEAIDGFGRASQWLEEDAGGESCERVKEHLRVLRYLLKREREATQWHAQAGGLTEVREWLVLMRSLRRLLRQERDGLLIKQSMAEIEELQPETSQSSWVTQRLAGYLPLDQVVFGSSRFGQNVKEINHEYSSKNNQE